AAGPAVATVAARGVAVAAVPAVPVAAEPPPMMSAIAAVATAVAAVAAAVVPATAAIATAAAVAVASPVAATVAESRGVGATGERHRKNDTVHEVSLLANKGSQPTRNEIALRPGALRVQKPAKAGGSYPGGSPKNWHNNPSLHQSNPSSEKSASSHFLPCFDK